MYYSICVTLRFHHDLRTLPADEVIHQLKRIDGALETQYIHITTIKIPADKGLKSFKYSSCG